MLRRGVAGLRSSRSLLSSRRYRHLAVNAAGLHGVLRQAGYSVRFFLSGVHRGWMGLELLYGADNELFVDGVSDLALIGEVVKLPARLPAAPGELLYFHLMSVHTSSQVEARLERWLPRRNRSDHLRRERHEARVLAEIRNHYVEFTTHPGSLPRGDRLAMEAVLCLMHGGLYKMLWHRRGSIEILRAAFDLSSDPQELSAITDEAILAELEARRSAFT